MVRGQLQRNYGAVHFGLIKSCEQKRGNAGPKRSGSEGSDRIGWARRGNASPKRYGCAGSEEFSLSLSSIHAPPRKG